MNRHWPLIVIILLALIWGSTWLGIKIGLDFFPPFLCAGFRFLSAYAFLRVWMWMQNHTFRSDAGTWRIMGFLGIQQALIYGLVFWGEQYIDSGISAVLFSTMPFFVLLFSLLMFSGQQIYASQLFGIVMSIAGTVMIYDPDLTTQPDFAKGFSAILLSAVISSFMAVYIKRYAGNIPPVKNTAVQMGVAGLLLTGIGMLTENPEEIRWSWKGIAAVLYLGVIGSAVAFALYMWVIKKVTPLSASVIPLLTPLVALLVGWLVLQEQITLSMTIGSGLVLTGVFFLSAERFPLFNLSRSSEMLEDFD